MLINKLPTPLCRLDETERANPMLVVDELFDFADLPTLRALMWRWLKTTATGTFHKELSASERSAIFTCFEKMEKLIEADCVMHAQHKEQRS